FHFSVDECGDTQEQAQSPHQQTTQFSKLWPTQSFMRQRVHQCHVTIYADQNQEVDAAVDIHCDGEIDQFAQGTTKRPVEFSGCTHSPEGQTGDQDKVSSSQVAQVDLSHGACLLVETEYHQDKHIKDDSQNSDDQDIDWHHSVD
uniref:Uncharacterized protein n=1 Tax=Lates calcarifer TaxID=8187 RepID=A0A4W6EP85_LATCA